MSLTAVRKVITKIFDLVPFLLVMNIVWILACNAFRAEEALGWPSYDTSFQTAQPPLILVPLFHIALAMVSIFIPAPKNQFTHCGLFLLWAGMPMVIRSLWCGAAAEQQVPHKLEQFLLAFNFAVVNAHGRDDGLESTGWYGKVMTVIIEFLSAPPEGERTS